MAPLLVEPYDKRLRGQFCVEQLAFQSFSLVFCFFLAHKNAAKHFVAALEALDADRPESLFDQSFQFLRISQV